MAAVRKRFGVGSVLGCVAMAVPLAAAAFLIYDKQRSMAEAALPAATQVASEAPDGRPAWMSRVPVAPTYADPELLKMKRQEDAKLRPHYESAQRDAEAREVMRTPGASTLKPTGNTRPSTVGPAPEPPEGGFLTASGELAAPISPSPSQGGAKFYGLPEDAPAVVPPPARGARRR